MRFTRNARTGIGRTLTAVAAVWSSALGGNLASPQPLAAQPGRVDSLRYGLLLTQGRDTTATERVEEVSLPGGARLTRAEVLVPNRVRLVVTARADADACVRDTEVRVFPWGAAPDATPVQRVAVRIDGDSVRVHVVARGVEQRAARPAGGAQAIVAQESEAVAATIVACALRRLVATGGDSLSLPVLIYPNLRLERLALRRRGDTLTVIGGRDTSQAILAVDGTVQSLELANGRLATHRVSWRTLDALPVSAPDYSSPADAPYEAREVHFAVGPLRLAGTLTQPRDRSRPVPAVVLISGSGAQEQDSHAPIADGWRPFRQLADTLGRRGVAVLRFDDRGVGASQGDQGTATERTTADDVRAALAFLRTQPGIDTTHLAVLGHSEGARVAMLVAAEEPSVAAVALVSGAADPRAATLAQALWQADHDPRLTGARDSVRTIVSRQLDSLARTSTRLVYRWDAAALARRMRAPVGIFHGATDRQVPVEQADLLAKVLRESGRRDVTVQLFPDRNHLLLRDPDGDFLRYDRLPTGRIDGEVLGGIVEWLLTRLRETGSN